jgi:hypothetical protein
MSDVSLDLFTNADQATLCATSAQRTVICRFRNPSRVIAVNISNDAWTRIAHIDATYRPLLEAVLYSAAQAIVSRYYLNAFEVSKVTVSSIPAHLLSNDAILEEAAGRNSEWMTKEELTEAWKASATRAAIFNAQRYATDRAYQRAFTRFEEMILKLAGKTTSYEEKELDTMLAKLADADLATQFGQFVVRRIEALRNKPNKQEIDLDVL